MQKELEKLALKNSSYSLSEELKAVQLDIELNNLKKENKDIKLKAENTFVTSDDLRKHLFMDS